MGIQGKQSPQQLPLKTADQISQLPGAVQKHLQDKLTTLMFIFVILFSLISVLSVQLLQQELPLLRLFRKAVVEPDTVFSEADVRRQDVFFVVPQEAFVLLIPELLSVEGDVFSPASSDFAQQFFVFFLVLEE